MAETERPRIQHDDMEHAIATFRRNYLESVKTGHWAAACWKILEDGTVELAGFTTWDWPDANQDDTVATLKKEIAGRSGPAPGESDPLPIADFQREIQRMAADGPPKEEGK